MTPRGQSGWIYLRTARISRHIYYLYQTDINPRSCAPTSAPTTKSCGGAASPYFSLRSANTALTSSSWLNPRSPAFASAASVGRESFAKKPVNPSRTPKARQHESSTRAAGLETKGMVIGTAQAR